MLVGNARSGQLAKFRNRYVNRLAPAPLPKSTDRCAPRRHFACDLCRYPGRISRITGNFYTISYDDGDVENNVPPAG